MVILLTKDCRKVENLKKYKNSPFPLLSNIEYFSNSIGEWNSELLQYGIKARHKDKDYKSEGQAGIRIHLIKYDTLNNKNNRYLIRQYQRLEKYRECNEIHNYWKLAWDLMTKSWSFKLASLNSWKPLWYKEYSLKELNKIWKGLLLTLKNEQTKPELTNVWIESPKGKWRQLCIPSKSWRLYFHMLNMWISYIYSNKLKPSLYDGFIYSRGCKSWWEYVLWSPILKQYNSLIELDFSSGFPNLSLHGVKQALLEDKLIPPNLINLILTHLNSRPKSANAYPTLETFIEDKENQIWRESCRSVPMGVGISPILFVITLNWTLNKLNLQTPNLTYKWYADDGSLYFNLKGLYFLLNPSNWKLSLQSIITGRNPLLTYLNESKLFKQVGLRICPNKSGLVRIFNIWLKPYKSLGLSYYTPLSIITQIKYKLLNKSIPFQLKGSTRGRGDNPSKNTKGTKPSNLLLNFTIDNKRRLDLCNLLTKYKPYFGLLMSKLYNGSSENILEKSTNKLKCHPQSLLGVLKPHNINKHLTKIEKLNLYNSGSKMNEIFLNMVNDKSNDLILLSGNEAKLKRELVPKWNNITRTGYEIDHKDLLTCLCWHKQEYSLEYFKKYSEIKLTTKQIREYNTLYQKDKDKRNNGITT